MKVINIIGYLLVIMASVALCNLCDGNMLYLIPSSILMLGTTLSGIE